MYQTKGILDVCHSNEVVLDVWHFDSVGLRLSHDPNDVID